MSAEKAIRFQTESLDFELKNQEHISAWISEVCARHKNAIGYFDYVFCSDDFLLEINKEYLDHDYYTDIITFPLGHDPLEANIFISIDRVKENAETYKVSFEDELHRVIIHGILHLLGFKDKSEEDQKTMRDKENESLELRSFV